MSMLVNAICGLTFKAYSIAVGTEHGQQRKNIAKSSRTVRMRRISERAEHTTCCPPVAAQGAGARMCLSGRVYTQLAFTMGRRCADGCNGHDGQQRELEESLELTAGPRTKLWVFCPSTPDPSTLIYGCFGVSPI